MATIGWTGADRSEPWLTASPKAYTCPADETSQYPRPSGVAAMAAMGWGRGRCGDPYDAAAPAAYTVPDELAIHSPSSASPPPPPTTGCGWPARRGPCTPPARSTSQ